MKLAQLAGQLGSVRGRFERRDHQEPSRQRARRSDHRDSSLQTAWQHLIRARDPICAVHQTEAYLAYLSDLGSATEVIVLENADTDQVTGIVPTRELDLDVSLKARNRRLVPIRIRGMSLLGTEPIGALDRPALDVLFGFIAERFRHVRAVEFNSLALDSPLHRHLLESQTVARHFTFHVLGGWREAHSIVLPPSLEAYEAKLPRKRRYNFKRQERLLEQALGQSLALRVIEAEHGLPTLFAALEQLGVSAGSGATRPRAHYEAAARHGLLLSFVLCAGARVIGAVSGIRSQDAYFVNDIWFDRALAKLSPGTTLWQMVLRRLIEE